MVDCDPSHPLNQPIRPKTALQRRQAAAKPERVETKPLTRAQRQMRLWARQDELNRLPEPMEAK